MTSAFSGRVFTALRPIYRRYLRQWAPFRRIAHTAVSRGWVDPTSLFQATLRAQAQDQSLDHQSAPPGVLISKALPIPGFELSSPLSFRLDPLRLFRPATNVVLPSLAMKHMTGGPNTALVLAMLLAEAGESVRLIGMDGYDRGGEDRVFAHMEGLLGRPALRDRLELVDATDRAVPVSVGRDDVMLGTAWWTVQALQPVLNLLGSRKFLYLIQDFEALLHDASTLQARAIETYGMDHVPIVNSKFLFEELQRLQIGRFGDPTFGSNAVVFEPALDRAHFFPDDRGSSARRRLLFYARPAVAKRNLFELGVMALRECVARGMFQADQWEVCAMGEQIRPVDLGSGQVLQPMPWLSFAEYARAVRQSDLMLSLMLSPHPSYPPLEMAASGRPVVTNSWGAKTVEGLQNLSPNFVPCEPTVDSIATALGEAATRIAFGLPALDPSGLVALPRSWDDSLRPVADRVLGVIRRQRTSSAIRCQPVPLMSRGNDNHSQMRRARLELRRESIAARQEPGLISFVTTVFDTKADYLLELAASVLTQDGGVDFEWFILDNGSSNTETREALQLIAKHSCVRLERVDRNLGIVSGMRYCLERASGAYVLPLDSDDLLEPDCVSVITSHLRTEEFPAIAYTDEDKTSEGLRGTAYHKPDWDPVLFLDSCYIAHLCAFDREKALELGVYTEQGAEGCHDWDTMLRFIDAGHVPLHISEVLYSWRIHARSTAGNIRSKDFIASSHRATLSRVIRSRGLGHVSLEESPLFDDGVDWRFRRSPQGLPSLDIVSLSPGAGGICSRGSKVARDTLELLSIVEASKADCIGLVHDALLKDEVEWLSSAVALFEIHPDTVVVGGPVIRRGVVVAGPIIFGFGNGVGSPDRGRPSSDPGYMATMWKHRSASAVSGGNCVVKRDFLLDALRAVVDHSSLALIGPWLGAEAARRRLRVAFSPFMRVTADNVLEDGHSKEDLAKFLVCNAELVPDRRFYSPRLGLDPATAYTEVHLNDREGHVARLFGDTPSFAAWENWRSSSRRMRLPAPVRITGVTVVTTVYEGTVPREFQELGAALRKQRDYLSGWIVVAHGPIGDVALAGITDAVKQAGGTLIRHPTPLGIMGAMREAVRHVRSEYFVPVDADDLVLDDGLRALCSELGRTAAPDLLFTNEAQIFEGLATAPYFRPGFDEILNLDSSYIWHACAIRRDAIERFGLYSDEGSTWCHDWDTVCRIWMSGGTIRHSEELVYLWRRHAQSTTNREGGDRRSLDSVRNVLDRVRRSLGDPSAFRVERCPINRGSEEYHLAWNGAAPAPVAWSLRSALLRALPDEALVVVASPSIRVDGAALLQESERLMRLHKSVGAIGFGVKNEAGVIIDGCEVRGYTGNLAHPWHGHSIAHGGPYALWQKCQTVYSTGRLIAVYRLGALKAVCSGQHHEWPSEPVAFNGLVRRLFASSSFSVAFSPFVFGTGSGAVRHEPSAPALGSRESSAGLLAYGRVPLV